MRKCMRCNRIKKNKAFIYKKRYFPFCVLCLLHKSTPAKTKLTFGQKIRKQMAQGIKRLR